MQASRPRSCCSAPLGRGGKARAAWSRIIKHVPSTWSVRRTEPAPGRCFFYCRLPRCLFGRHLASRMVYRCLSKGLQSPAASSANGPPIHPLIHCLAPGSKYLWQAHDCTLRRVGTSTRSAKAKLKIVSSLAAASANSTGHRPLPTAAAHCPLPNELRPTRTSLLHPLRGTGPKMMTVWSSASRGHAL